MNDTDLDEATTSVVQEFKDLGYSDSNIKIGEQVQTNLSTIDIYNKKFDVNLKIEIAFWIA